MYKTRDDLVGRSFMTIAFILIFAWANIFCLVIIDFVVLCVTQLIKLERMDIASREILYFCLMLMDYKIAKDVAKSMIPIYSHLKFEVAATLIYLHNIIMYSAAGLLIYWFAHRPNFNFDVMLVQILLPLLFISIVSSFQSVKCLKSD